MSDSIQPEAFESCPLEASPNQVQEDCLPQRNEDGLPETKYFLHEAGSFPGLEAAAAIAIQKIRRIRFTPPVPSTPSSPWQPVMVPALVPTPIVRIRVSESPGFLIVVPNPTQAPGEET